MTTTSIIECGGVVFVTRPFPAGDPSRLTPSWEGQTQMGVKAGARASHDNTYFMVILTDLRTSHADLTPEEWAPKVRQVLQYLWDELVNRGDEKDPMPDIILGNPLNMLGITLK